MKPLYELLMQETDWTPSDSKETITEKIAISGAFDFLQTRIKDFPRYVWETDEPWELLLDEIDRQIKSRQFLMETDSLPMLRHDITIEILESQKLAILYGGDTYRKLILGDEEEK